MSVAREFVQLLRGSAPAKPSVGSEARVYAAEDGSLRTILSDGTDAPVGGGASPVQAAYSGDNVTVANFDSANLPFTNLDGGTDLLDRTDPAIPTFLAAGTYAVTARARGALTAGGTANASLIVAGPDIFASVMNDVSQECGIAGVAVVSAGDTLRIELDSYDGAAPQDFRIGSVFIVKLA